jgi:hypothetical protein
MSCLACKCSPQRGVPQVGLRNVFGGGGGGGGGGSHKSATRPSAAETEAAAEAAASTRKESAAVQARVAELKRKQQAGELSADEMAELAASQTKLTQLEAQAQRLEAVAAAGAAGAGDDLWEGSDAEAEALAVKERISELTKSPLIATDGPPCMQALTTARRPRRNGSPSSSDGRCPVSSRTRRRPSSRRAKRSWAGSRPR